MANFVDSFVTNYLGPLYILAIAIFGFRYVKEQQFRQLFNFIAIVTIVALLIFSGNYFFGKNGKLTNTAQNIVEQIN